MILISFERTEILIGPDKWKELQEKKIAVIGLGGVGGYVLEALARAGIIHLHIFDFDRIDSSNINRQIIATTNNIGRKKVDCFKERLKLINANIVLRTCDDVISAQNIENLFDKDYDYVAECIDDMAAKIALVSFFTKQKVPIISCMGAGFRLHPEKFTITDIKKTSHCPVAKIMRKKCREENIESLTVCFSTEQPINSQSGAIGSISYVPSAAGLLIASHIVNHFIEEKEEA